jgi:hypothetical protein
MTERERIREETPRQSVGVYTTRSGRATDGDSYAGDDATVAPADLVRWGPVVAGIFACFATLATLTVLGLAIGLSSFDIGDPAGPFGLGAGIWGAISVLIAFLVGGYFAGRTAAVRGTKSGVLQGGMVWFVTIPLLLYMLSGTLSGLASAAGGAAGTAAEVAGNAAGQVADDPAVQATAQAGAAGAAGSLQATATAVVGQVDGQDVQNVVENAGQAAWGTLLSLGLAAAAAILGGYLGAQAPAVRRPLGV